MLGTSNCLNTDSLCINNALRNKSYLCFEYMSDYVILISTLIADFSRISV